MLKRGSTKPCDLDTYELDWDDLGMQLPSMPQKAPPSAPEPAPAPASAPRPEATQAHPTEEWTLARLERKVMEEESFEKRRKSSSAMRALEECYEDAAWDSFDVSETNEVAPAQPAPMGVQVPQELRRPEEQPKLGDSRPRAREAPPRGPAPAMRPGQAPGPLASGPQRRVQCPAPGVPGGLAKASAKTPGPGPPPAVKHQSMQHPGAGPAARMPAPTKYQAMPAPNPAPKVPGAKPFPGAPLTKAPGQPMMRPQAPGQPRFAAVQRQLVAPSQMPALGAMRAGTGPTHNPVPAHPHEAQPQLSTPQPEVRLVPQATPHSQTQQVHGQQVDVMLMPQAALQQHEPQQVPAGPGPQDVRLVPQPQPNHAQPQAALQPQEPVPRNLPSEQAEVRLVQPAVQQVPTGQQPEFRLMPQPAQPQEAQPKMPGQAEVRLLPQSQASRLPQDSSQATILYPSPASGFRPETQRQIAAAPAALGQSSLEAPSESEKQGLQAAEMSDGTPVAPAAQVVMGGSCATSVASANGSRGPDRMLNKLLAQPCSTRLQRTGYVSPLPPGPQVTLAHPTYAEATHVVAAPPDAGNLPESVALPMQFEAVEEYPGFQVPMAPRAAQAPMCGSASVPTAPWVFARPQDVLSRSAAQLPIQAPPQRQGVPPPPSRSDSAPVVGLCEPITLAAAEPRASAEPVAIAVAADNDAASSTRSPTWVSALSGFADPAEVGKPVRDWTEDDVAQWLMKLSTVPADILDVVHLHAISGAVLLSMTEEDLEGLRIEKFGHRRLLLLAAQELRRTVQVANDRPGPGGSRGLSDFAVALSPSSSIGSGAGIAGAAYSVCVPQGRNRVLSPSPMPGAQSVPVAGGLMFQPRVAAPRSWAPQVPLALARQARSPGPGMIPRAVPTRGNMPASATPQSPPPHLRPQVLVAVPR
ncbi:unnamed protein product [Symbiodinium sp. CCMP2592]|nr:unnamed protein product [Symbiodinium sp. CCMP2592]